MHYLSGFKQPYKPGLLEAMLTQNICMRSGILSYRIPQSLQAGSKPIKETGQEG